MSYRFTRDTAESILTKAPSRYVPPASEFTIDNLAGASAQVEAGLITVMANANTLVIGAEIDIETGTMGMIAIDSSPMITGASVTASAGTMAVDVYVVPVLLSGFSWWGGLLTSLTAQTDHAQFVDDTGNGTPKSTSSKYGSFLIAQTADGSTEIPGIYEFVSGSYNLLPITGTPLVANLSCCFSPDEQWAFFTISASTIRAYQYDGVGFTYRASYTFNSSNTVTGAIACSSDFRIAYGSLTPRIQVVQFDPDDYSFTHLGQSTATTPFGQEARNIDWSPDGRWILVGWALDMSVYDSNTYPMSAISAGFASTEGAFWSLDGTKIISVTQSGPVRVSSFNGSVITSLTTATYTNALNAASMNSGRSHLACNGNSNEIRVFQINGSEIIPYGNIDTVATNPSGMALFTNVGISSASVPYIIGNPPDTTLNSVYSYTFTATAGTPPYVLWEIISGSLPTGITLNSSTGEISGTASSINTFTFTLKVTDSIGNSSSTAFDIEVTSGFGNMYVGQSSGVPGSSFHTIDAYTDTVVFSSVDIGGISSLLPSNDETKVYYTNNGGDFGYIDVGTNLPTVLNNTNNYSGVISDSTNTYFYCLSQFPGNTFYKMDASGTIIDTKSMPAQPAWMSMSSDGSKIYVPTYTSALYYIYDTATQTMTSENSIYNGTRAACLSPDGSLLWIVGVDGGTNDGILWSMDLATATLNDYVVVPDGETGSSIVFHPDGNTMAVCNFNNYAGKVWIYDTATMTLQETIDVGGQPSFAMYSLNGEKLYVANYSTNDISVIDTATYTIITTIPCAFGPRVMVVI